MGAPGPHPPTGSAWAAITGAGKRSTGEPGPFRVFSKNVVTESRKVSGNGRPQRRQLKLSSLPLEL